VHTFHRVPGRRLLAAAALALASSFAHATDIWTGDLSVTSSDPTQLGRVSRNGIPQDWSGGEAWPGVINTSTSYHYEVLDLNIAALEASLGLTYGSYLQITVDSASTNTFVAGYLNSYDPTSAASLQATWLGDPGTSGLAFGTDPLSFQVQVGQGGHLLLVMNETTTNAGLFQPAHITLEAFSDTMYTDLAPAVPEPATWSMMGAGVLLLALRRRRQSQHDAA